MRVKAWGAVTPTDRGLSDGKPICSDHPPSRAECRNVLRFFHFCRAAVGGRLLWPTRVPTTGSFAAVDGGRAVTRLQYPPSTELLRTTNGRTSPEFSPESARQLVENKGSNCRKRRWNSLRRRAWRA